MLCLVVDDSKSARFTLSRVLKNLGHEVLTAENGENALEVLCEHSPDMIFMDHHMPGLDGFETAKKIRGQAKFAELPIIMCTAKDDADYADQAKRIGLTGTLPKPASQQQIKASLDALVPMRQTSTPTSALNVNAADANEASARPPIRQTSRINQVPSAITAGGIELSDQIRVVIRAEAQGRARDAAEKLLAESWGRLRGNLQEDVREQTKDMFERHIEQAMATITVKVETQIRSSLSLELRNQLDKKISATDHQLQVSQNEFNGKLSSIKRQLELQKFDPLALQETILEDARREAEYTATHKAVDTANKIARELCEDTMEELLGQSVLETYEKQVEQLTEYLESLQHKTKTLTTITTFAAVLSVFAFAVAFWALV